MAQPQTSLPQVTLSRNSTLPNSTSSDYDAMYNYWVMVESIIGGTTAMQRAGQRFLPKFPNEEPADYKYRLENSVFTNVYADIINNLAAKPFAEELTLVDPVPDNYKELANDIDGRGNSINVFAQETFFWGINFAVDWILVDYPNKNKVAPDKKILTLADEKNLGLRPYWLHITAPRMLAVYSDTVNGEEIFTHARILETKKERAGFSEITIERVRVFDREAIVDDLGNVKAYAPAIFQIWQKKTRSDGAPLVNNQVQWELVDQGNVSIGVIPIVPFITGRRLESTWQFIPAMRDCAHCQIEHYQAETGLKSIKELTAFPMLAGNGVAPPADKNTKIAVGPRSILYATPFGEGRSHGQWQFIEPQGSSLTFLAKEIERLESQMRELGRQPLTAQSGNLTVVTTQFAAQKGNSAVQSWALNLKDAMEQAWYITNLWLKRPDQKVEVRIYTDFALEAGDDTTPPLLMQMRTNGDLSQDQLWEEMRRRNALSADFDPNVERKLLAKEKAQSQADAKAQADLETNNQIKVASVKGQAKLPAKKVGSANTSKGPVVT